VARLRLFAAAREAAGTATTDIDAATVGAVLDEACARFGARFAEVLDTARVWVNGEPADRDTRCTAADTVAVLPPVSGG
jgi:MoaD family protein